MNYAFKLTKSLTISVNFLKSSFRPIIFYMIKYGVLRYWGVRTWGVSDWDPDPLNDISVRLTVSIIVTDRNLFTQCPCSMSTWLSMSSLTGDNADVLLLLLPRVELMPRTREWWFLCVGAVTAGETGGSRGTTGELSPGDDEVWSTGFVPRWDSSHLSQVSGEDNDDFWRLAADCSSCCPGNWMCKKSSNVTFNSHIWRVRFSPSCRSPFCKDTEKMHW